MTYELAFSAINVAVMPAWFLLVALPRSGMTNTLVHSGIYPLALGSVYAVCLVLSMFFGVSAEGTGFTSIGGVSALFDHPNGVLIGWTHYLVFDLFIGAWIGRDAVRRSVTHWLAAPSMLLSYVFGPVGLFVYLISRAATGRGGLSLAEA